MDRRSFVAASVFAISGCVGGRSGQPTTQTSTTTDTETATPTETSTHTATPTPGPGAELPQSRIFETEEQAQVADLGIELGTWTYSNDIRYYNEEKDELDFVSLTDEVFLSATFRVTNLGGETVDYPTHENVSFRYDGELFSPICSLPEGISFEQLRESGQEYAIRVPDCGDDINFDSIGPGDLYYYRALGRIPDPEQAIIVKWETQKKNAEPKVAYFRIN